MTFRLSSMARAFGLCVSTVPIPTNSSWSSGSGPLEHVGHILAADGFQLSSAHVETLRWRVEPLVGASITTAMLGGKYRVYAAGEHASDGLAVTIMDKSTGVIVGKFLLTGSLPATSGTVTLGAASILSISVEPTRAVINRGVAEYDIALPFVRLSASRE